MLRLYGFPTQNSMKTLYVLEESGIDFEFVFVDLAQGEQNSASFQQKTPMGKVPLLEHDGEYLFESGAICRYVGNISKSPLYPEDALQRARVDQWLDFFSCHLGRWFSTIFFEQVIKPKYGLGESNAASIEEATTFAGQQLEMLNGLLEKTDWLANDAFSIADLFAFAYVEQYRVIEFPLQEYPNVQAWFDRVEARSSVAKARARLPA